MSFKAVYLSLSTQLIAQIPSLRVVGFFNNQFENSQHDETDLNRQQAVPYPCVFIEFSGENEQVAAGAGNKQLDVEITFHIGVESYNLDPIEMFDIIEAVEVAVEGFSDADPDGKGTFAPLTYNRQNVCHDFTNVLVHKLIYTTTYNDTLRSFHRNDVIKTGSQLQVEVNRVQPPYTIDNNGSIHSDI